MYGISLGVDECAIIEHILMIISQLLEEETGNHRNRYENNIAIFIIQSNKDIEEITNLESDENSDYYCTETDDTDTSENGDKADSARGVGGVDKECAADCIWRQCSQVGGTRLELSEALFQLSMMFWTHQNQAGDMTMLTIVHFTGVIGIYLSSLAF